MGWLVPLYIGATIFGVGITAADLLGAFSSLTGGEGDADAGESGDAADDAGDVTAEADAGGADADSGDADVDAGDAGDADAGDADADAGEADASEAGEEAEVEAADGEQTSVAARADSGRPSVVAHDARRRGDVALRLMSVFRSLVYFALGFGPVGWFATSQYSSVGATLAWSVPVGAVVMVGTRLLRSLMKRDLSSDITAEDILMEQGVVTVSIGKGEMGKVRLKAGGRYVERFARARDPKDVLPVGTTIRVTDVAEDCVTVEAE